MGVAYPQAWKQPRMSEAVTVRRAGPIASCNVYRVRAATDRSLDLTFDQTFSMGFKSGL